MQNSPSLSLPYLQPQQSQKHVTVNESLRRLDALVQMSARSAALAIEPPAPSEGDLHILPAGAAGSSWGAFAEGALAVFQDGAWVEIAPRKGWRAYVEDENRFLYFDGSGWEEFGGSSAPQFGVNTTADATNRLAVKSDAVLFNHDDVTPGSGDMRAKVNKATTADTGSHLFQTNASGRAEFGLIGDDDFTLKVSADGAAWNEALSVARTSGEVTIAEALILPDGVMIINRGTGASAGAEIEGGGNLGPCSLKVINQAGVAAGAVFTQKSSNPSIDLIDFGLQTLTKLMLLRAEARAGSVSVGAPEFQIMDNSTGAATILFRVGATAAKSENPFIFPSYAKAALPSAVTAGAGAAVFVTDEAGGAVLAFSDGANWRRVTDRAVVS